MDYIQLFIKFSLGILTLIIQINAFGKSNLAPTTALDQLQNYVLGGIIGGLIYNQSITVFHTISYQHMTIFNYLNRFSINQITNPIAALTTKLKNKNY